MKKNSLAFTIFRITLLASVFFGLFQLGNYILKGDTVPLQDGQISVTVEDTSSSNATRFQSAYSSQFGVIGVALSTRIGMTYSDVHQGTGRSNRFYTGVTSLPQTAQDRRQIRERLLTQNILFMREYYNLSRTDIIDALKTSTDRGRTLDNFVSQIELRKEGATKSIENIQNQRKLYLDELNRISRSIEDEKEILEGVFNSGDTRTTIEASENYFALRNVYTELFTDIVFMNQFIRQYEFLNDYNVGIVNVLKVNRQQIIDRTFVVIPNSGSEFLRPLELIFDERDIQR